MITVGSGELVQIGCSTPQAILELILVNWEELMFFSKC